jgi:hypothetical protein
MSLEESFPIMVLLCKENTIRIKNNQMTKWLQEKKVAQALMLPMLEKSSMVTPIIEDTKFANIVINDLPDLTTKEAKSLVDSIR